MVRAICQYPYRSLSYKYDGMERKIYIINNECIDRPFRCLFREQIDCDDDTEL
jgi:hypothetical protein